MLGSASKGLNVPKDYSKKCASSLPLPAHFKWLLCFHCERDIPLECVLAVEYFCQQTLLGGTEIKQDIPPEMSVSSIIFI